MRHAGRNKALVASWVDFLSPPLRELAESVRRQVHQTSPELSEAIQWGRLVCAFEGVPAFALLPARNHLNLQLLPGCAWPEAVVVQLPALRGTRQWRLDPAHPVDPVLLEMVISGALAYARERAADRPPRLRDEPA